MGKPIGGIRMRHHRNPFQQWQKSRHRQSKSVKQRQRRHHHIRICGQDLYNRSQRHLQRPTKGSVDQIQQGHFLTKINTGIDKYNTQKNIKLPGFQRGFHTLSPGFRSNSSQTSV